MTVGYASLPDLSDLRAGQGHDDSVPYLRLVSAILLSAVRAAGRNDADGSDARAAISAGFMDYWLSVLCVDDESYERSRLALRQAAHVAVEREVDS